MDSKSEQDSKTGFTYHVKVRIYRGDVVLGPGIAELMERISRTASLAEACREMEMSYSKGWKIIRRAEGALGFPLMKGHRGGSDGGQMNLTEEGLELLRKYRSFETEVNQFAEKKFLEYFDDDFV